ncbi:MAG: hypothetical protein MUC36_21200 [Planctomycetes bacterium]|jgi:hypothetical protein|nr:hypothetical protein [Planctomycetota bacterium]
MKRPLVGISVGDAEEQLELGFGEEHLAEALVRLSRLLLRAGCDLAYGGDLRPHGFTQLLLELVRAEGADREVGTSPPRSAELRRLVNPQSWPAHRSLTADHRARYLGVCRFVCVDPPAPLVGGDPDIAMVRELDLLRAPLSLSHMRRAMAFGGLVDADGRKVPAAAARIVLGGKMRDFKGLMPGILEEVAWALLAGDAPVIVLGGFGGAAAALARSVLAGQLLPELSSDVLRQASTWSQVALPVLEREPFATKFATFDPRLCERALVQFCKAGVKGLAARCELAPAQVEVLLRSSDFDAVRAVLVTMRWRELGKREGKRKLSVARGSVSRQAESVAPPARRSPGRRRK